MPLLASQSACPQTHREPVVVAESLIALAHVSLQNCWPPLSIVASLQVQPAWAQCSILSS
jgi:hypothetical protein